MMMKISCPDVTSAATLVVGLAAAMHLYRVNNDTDDRFTLGSLNRQRVEVSALLFALLALMTAACVNRRSSPIAYYGGLAISVSLLAGCVAEYMENKGVFSIASVWSIRENNGTTLQQAGRYLGYAAFAGGLGAMMYHSVADIMQRIGMRSLLRGGEFADYESFMSTEI